MTDIKICGLTQLDQLQACTRFPVKYLGFVFVPESGCYIAPHDAAWLAGQAPTSHKTVGLFADADDETIMDVIAKVPLSMIQLHGDEAPERVAHIAAMTSMPISKAIPIFDHVDRAMLRAYEAVSDWLLFDTKTADGRTGGSGEVFDWSLLKDLQLSRPWMLAGGLNATNVGQALSILSPTAVDVSSGVETARGKKDACKIQEFVEAVRS